MATAPATAPAATRARFTVVFLDGVGASVLLAFNASFEAPARAVVTAFEALFTAFEALFTTCFTAF